MLQIDASDVNECLDFVELISELENAYSEAKIEIPKKTRTTFLDQWHNKNDLMIMPAVESGNFVGVKILTICKGNQAPLPSHKGTYLLFNANTGILEASIDGIMLTNIRTACTSALAASKLANKDASTLLIVGNGNLCEFMIKAHTKVREYSKIIIWGRNHAKSAAVKSNLSQPLKDITDISTNLSQSMHKADVVSSVTSSEAPIIMAEDCRAGQHIDLVGAYRLDMQELDESILPKANVFIDDTLESLPKWSAYKQAIDLKLVPTVRCDLWSIHTDKFQRSDVNEITIFKSTGMAIQDLVAAKLLIRKINAR